MVPSVGADHENLDRRFRHVLIVSHFVTVDRYSFCVPAESFLESMYFSATFSRLTNMTTTPRPSTLAFRARLRQPMAFRMASRRSCYDDATHAGCTDASRLTRSAAKCAVKWPAKLAENAATASWKQNAKLASVAIIVQLANRSY